jgi:hypothetical protein
MIRGLRDFLMLAIAGTALASMAGAIPTTILGVQRALAANEHANANAGDHGVSPDTGGGPAVGLAHADSHATDSPGGGPPTSVPAGAKPQGIGVATASVHAEAGALNAVRANLQAFKHANFKSEVGLIAAYAKAVVQVEDDLLALATREAAFDASLAGFKAAYPPPAYPDYSIETLQARQDYLMGLPMPLSVQDQAELAALTAALSTQAALDLMDAQETLLADQMLMGDALQTASNKPVTGPVEAWLDAQLEQAGILDFYRTQ